MNASGYTSSPEELAFWRNWIDDLGKNSCCVTECIAQGWGALQFGASVIGTPLTIGNLRYTSGFGTHATSRIRLRRLSGATTFSAWVGADRNHDSLTSKNPPKLRFKLQAGGKTLAESPELTLAMEAWRMEVALDGVDELELLVDCDSEALAHADWAEVKIVNQAGRMLEPGLALPCEGGLPIYFTLDDSDSDAFFRRWGMEQDCCEYADRVEHRYRSGGADAGLEVIFTLKEFKKIPAAEWDVVLNNPGHQPTARIGNFQFLRFDNPATELRRGRGSFHHGHGAEAYSKSFEPVIDQLSPETRLIFGGTEGRSSVEYLPYFNAFHAMREYGFVFAAGWTGQWQATVTADGTRLCLEDFNARLLPGESLRMPSALVIHYRGRNPLRGQNLLRRQLNDAVLPRDAEGRPMRALLADLTWGGMTEADHLQRLDFIRRNRIDFDCYWIDAGWYGPAGTVSPDEFDPAWASNTGNWNFNPTILPQGLKKISAAAHAASLRQLLWMEPERAIQGTRITEEHPEWFLGADHPGASRLLDLGNPEAWQWCFDSIAALIEENSLDCFRQDFNLSPRSYWREKEAEDRCGIREVKFINGLYRLWRTLRQKFPHLLIDNCATGGRRLDFAALRHTVALWACDMECFSDVTAEWQQQHVFGLSYWLPVFSFGTQNQSGGDTYHFRSTLASGAVVHLFTYQKTPVSETYPVAWLSRMLAEARRVTPFHSGDFYPLSEYSTTHQNWTVMQFDRPDLEAGVLKIFRSATSPYRSAMFRLQGVCRAKNYLLTDADGKPDGAGIFSGRQLREEGLTLSLPEPRSARIIFYRATSE